jgi:hypothetical protein
MAWSGPRVVARVGTYHVPTRAALDDDLAWAVTKSGQYVRVPLHAYRTRDRCLASVWGLGIQIGLAFLESFRSHHGENAVKSIVLVLGNDCTDMAYEGEQAFRAYAGLAVIT